MRAAKLLGDDLESGILRLKLTRALKDMFDERSDRKGELHVSDFTAKSFCARKLVRRFFEGESRKMAPSWIHYDGLEREEKWAKLFERAGILRDRQKELKVGILVGHPDFHVDFGRGMRIVELTGKDPRIPISVQSMRKAVKRRQLTLYLLMDRVKRGFVFVEDKGSGQVEIEAIEVDTDLARELIERVRDAKRGIRRYNEAKKLPGRCDNERCKTCHG